MPYIIACAVICCLTQIYTIFDCKTSHVFGNCVWSRGILLVLQSDISHHIPMNMVRLPNKIRDVSYIQNIKITAVLSETSTSYLGYSLISV